MAVASANKGDESSLFMPQQETEKIEQVTEMVSPILALLTSLLVVFAFLFLC